MCDADQRFLSLNNSRQRHWVAILLNLEHFVIPAKGSILLFTCTKSPAYAGVT